VEKNTLRHRPSLQRMILVSYSGAAALWQRAACSTHDIAVPRPARRAAGLSYSSWRFTVVCAITVAWMALPQFSACRSLNVDFACLCRYS